MTHALFLLWFWVECQFIKDRAPSKFHVSGWKQAMGVTPEVFTVTGKKNSDQQINQKKGTKTETSDSVLIW